MLLSNTYFYIYHKIYLVSHIYYCYQQIGGTRVMSSYFARLKFFLMLNRPPIDNQKKKTEKFHIGDLHPKKKNRFFTFFSAAIVVILLVFGIVASNYILLRYMIQPMNNLQYFKKFLPKMCFLGPHFLRKSTISPILL